ncbi:hypothetical protein Pme01_43920 [Planosporangium mesophilum]|uniref:Uncharacterized protein n=1 Tax=Planosporangium mesophilum TaxID=689768 RepID=A0A8J3TP15_9ACTN|nr:hypothetical protein Pme01_43920 [Planosporangium mesophilum]
MGVGSLGVECKRRVDDVSTPSRPNASMTTNAPVAIRATLVTGTQATLTPEYGGRTSSPAAAASLRASLT